MLKATITLKGRTSDDLEDALNEVKRLVSEGFTSGKNNNDSGGFTLAIEGEEEMSNQFRILSKKKLTIDDIEEVFADDEVTGSDDDGNWEIETSLSIKEVREKLKCASVRATVEEV